jgi:DNA replication initiation complex subunit (GINS family)
MISYSVLRDIERQELMQASLVPLPENFYDLAKDYLAELEKNIQNGGVMALREYDNVKRIIKRIMEKREEKVVLLAVRGVETENLTKEEKELFYSIKQRMEEYRKNLTPDGTESVKKERVKKVRMVREVEAYTAPDGNVYGPFKEKEEVVLPSEEAITLVKAKLAEEVIE